MKDLQLQSIKNCYENPNVTSIQTPVIFARAAVLRILLNGESLKQNAKKLLPEQKIFFRHARNLVAHAKEQRYLQAQAIPNLFHYIDIYLEQLSHIGKEVDPAHLFTVIGKTSTYVEESSSQVPLTDNDILTIIEETVETYIDNLSEIDALNTIINQRELSEEQLNSAHTDFNIRVMAACECILRMGELSTLVKTLLKNLEESDINEINMLNNIITNLQQCVPVRHKLAHFKGDIFKLFSIKKLHQFEALFRTLLGSVKAYFSFTQIKKQGFLSLLASLPEKLNESKRIKEETCRWISPYLNAAMQQHEMQMLAIKNNMSFLQDENDFSGIFDELLAFSIPEQINGIEQGYELDNYMLAQKVFLALCKAIAKKDSNITMTDFSQALSILPFQHDRDKLHKFLYNLTAFAFNLRLDANYFAKLIEVFYQFEKNVCAK